MAPPPSPAIALTAVLAIGSLVSFSGAAGTPAWWDDVDYERHSCGKSKCYFPSASDPAKGYLVLDCVHPASLRKAVEAYEYAALLESKHDVRQFFSSPPYESNTPNSVAGYLAARELKKYCEFGSSIVQESTNAPEGSRLFKCHESPYDYLEYMIAHGNEGYERVLLEEMSRASQLLEHEPTLAFDFQFMMDLDGRIYHMDLDRALSSRGKKLYGLESVVSSARACLEKAANYIRSSMDES